MAAFKITRKQRLVATICISAAFFVAELTAGFYTHSLALIADAFHYLSDVVGFVVALVALMMSERATPPPKEYTYGWQRATLLGAFFNGVFLLALGVSILVQAIERFTDNSHIDQPKVVLIIGSVGLSLNLLVMSFLHEHDHHQHQGEHCHSHAHVACTKEHVGQSDDDDMPVPEGKFEGKVEARKASTASSCHSDHKHVTMALSKPGRDLGVLGVFVHVVGDAINNIGVIISALIIWKTQSPARFYADPAIGVFIAVMIFLTAVPLTKNSGKILLQIAPKGVDVEDVKHDIEMIDGVQSVHELHVWRLDQWKSVASAHIVIDGRTIQDFAEKAKVIMECLHDYGIHSATLQPENLPPLVEYADPGVNDNEAIIRQRRINRTACQLACSSVCAPMRCCT